MATATKNKKNGISQSALVAPLTQFRPIGDLRINPNNVRTHSKKQIRQIANSIEEFGFAVPICVDENGFILAGHGRLQAAQLLGLKTVPVVQVVGLSEARKRAFMLADNKIASNAGWDLERLAHEVQELSELLSAEDLGIAVTGFESIEVDQLISDFEEDSADPADGTDPATVRR